MLYSYFNLFKNRFYLKFASRHGGKLLDSNDVQERE